MSQLLSATQHPQENPLTPFSVQDYDSALQQGYYFGNSFQVLSPKTAEAQEAISCLSGNILGKTTPQETGTLPDV